MSPYQKELNEQYYIQVTESIKSIFELTARVDERVQLMMKKQDEIEKKMDMSLEQVTDLSARVKMLETQNDNLLHTELDKIKQHVQDLQVKMGTMEKANENHESRWHTVMNLFFQVVGVISVAYLLYKLGLQAPP